MWFFIKVITQTVCASDNGGFVVVDGGIVPALSINRIMVSESIDKKGTEETVAIHME